jgi:hypothetical protein
MNDQKLRRSTAAKLSFLGREGSGVELARMEPPAQPDHTGLIASYEVELPNLKAASYFAPFQRYDPIPRPGPLWPEAGNRIQPLRIDDFHDLAVGGHFLLLRLQGGSHLALLPMAGPHTLAWFTGEAGRLRLDVGTFGTAPVKGQLPLCAWAFDADPYLACRAVWQTAAESPLIDGSTRMRDEKHYPDIFRYLGWCTWEEYKFRITENLLLDAVDMIEASFLPIRYLLVDNGHVHMDTQGRLISFEPDGTKFPNGWEPLLARRRDDRIRWMGLWLNFNGYCYGISPENRLGDLNDHLEPVGETLQPRNTFLDAVAFYDAMLGAARRSGFDFVKADNQARNLLINSGTSNGVERASNNAQALEIAAARHLDGLVNCMAHNAVCVFNTRISAVSRCSEDYVVGDLDRARRHLHNSYGNIPWIGQTVWGDHDMFHSNDSECGQVMAISKAMSGGPVYLSDCPDSFQHEVVLPLCYRDGELLRPLAPAAPVRECVFSNPFEDGEPYVVVAPLTGGAAACVAYNLTEPETAVRGTIRLEHYADAGCMLPAGAEAGWNMPDEGFVLYAWERKEAVLLSAPHSYEIGGFGGSLYLLTPIHSGWSVIGRIDKYLAPAAVDVIVASPDELVVRLRESGPFAVWSDYGELYVPGSELEPVTNDNRLWIFDLAVGEENSVVRVRRR